jgi:hypothetical protein
MPIAKPAPNMAPTAKRTFVYDSPVGIASAAYTSCEDNNRAAIVENRVNKVFPNFRNIFFLLSC